MIKNIWRFSFWIAVIPSILLFLITNYLIPFSHSKLGMPLIYAWFLNSTVFIFLPMTLFAIYQMKKDDQEFFKRARFCRITGSTFGYSMLGVILIGVLSALIMKVMSYLIHDFSPQPEFMHLSPIHGNYWVLIAWLPMFFFNVIGEALYWHSWILPLQEKRVQSKAFLLNAFVWFIFHLAFGWKLLVVLLPIVIITPFIVQKTRNTWSSVIIHALINGNGFLLIAFGII